MHTQWFSPSYLFSNNINLHQVLSTYPTDSDSLVGYQYHAVQSLAAPVNYIAMQGRVNISGCCSLLIPCYVIIVTYVVWSLLGYSYINKWKSLWCACQRTFDVGLNWSVIEYDHITMVTTQPQLYLIWFTFQCYSSIY